MYRRKCKTETFNDTLENYSMSKKLFQKSEELTL